MIRTLRFHRQFLLSGDTHVVRRDTTYVRGAERLPASLYAPVPADSPGEAGPGLPGWVALHGLTCRGREHPSLDRFARSLAASGAVVLIPDLPEWRALRVAPEATVETIEAAVPALERSARTRRGRIGVIGFSFGATQALVAATKPALRDRLAGIAAWGGYADITRATRFAFTGRHELDGVGHRMAPDPYGRWILAGNYLTLLSELAGESGLADALHGLAREAGRRGIMSYSPETDPLKEAARSSLGHRERELFDLLAPPADHEHTEPELTRLEELATRLAEAAIAREPLLEAGPYLRAVDVPVFLAHGRGDRLVPWTEMPRLERALGDRVAYSGITNLFSHSFGEKRWPTPGVVLEGLRFVRLIHRMLNLI
jgi:pimeloyl-ACP methyl ester carboxylesterase